jgi:uncharacterized protein YbaP (TraB family)
MKKIVTLLLVLASLSGNAQIENSLLWKIEGNGLETPSYLFGTIHLITQKDFFITTATQRAFESCKTLALEVDLNMSKETKKEISKSALLPSGKVIDDYCTSEELNLIKSFMADTVKVSALKIKFYSRFKPIYLQSILIQEQLKQSISYEKTFAKKAKKNKMNQVGLETITFQLKMMDTIPLDYQIKEMAKSIKDGKANIRYFNELIATYKSQNIDKLHQLAIDDGSVTSNFVDVLFNKRNTEWIPSIEGLVRKQPTFIAVGAGHLAGEKGVINLLRARGYTLTPILEN